MDFARICTRCTVRLKKVKNCRKWRLYIETYPLYKDDCTSPKRECLFLNRTITTPQWKTKNERGKYLTPKRDSNGVIICKSPTDNEACRFAEAVRFRLQNIYDSAAINIMRYMPQDIYRSVDFLPYFKSYITRCNVSDSMRYIYSRVYRLFENFLNLSPIIANEFDSNLVEKFRKYLLMAHLGGNREGNLSRNSAAVYLSVLKTVLKSAFRDGLFKEDISLNVRGIKCSQPIKEYLSIEELNKLLHTPCRNETLKRAALFSALTGLRHCDIKNLKARNLHLENGKHMISFIQKKTGGTVYLPISHQAYILCHYDESDREFLFNGLQSTSCIARPLKQWIASAGIKKHITFHCFRHTYATLQLAGGTDIYTLCSMMGHSSIRTTQIYAKIVDKNKIRATEVIRLDI